MYLQILAVLGQSPNLIILIHLDNVDNADHTDNLYNTENLHNLHNLDKKLTMYAQIQSTQFGQILYHMDLFYNKAFLCPV